jgi:hypothetical protein
MSLDSSRTLTNLSQKRAMINDFSSVSLWNETDIITIINARFVQIHGLGRKQHTLIFFSIFHAHFALLTYITF